MALKGINHVVLKVRDLDTAERFYRLLGFEPAGTRDDLRMRFFHGGAHAHDLALKEMGADAPESPRDGVGLFHFCVTVEDEAELSVLRDRLREAGYRVSDGVDHIVSHSFYTRDPDGNGVEVTWDTPEADWRHLDNPFAQDRPLDLPPGDGKG
ncbi:MAG TPA: VOC family protein [bacterium]|nr:VOC family protein [bacterium]